MIRKYEAKLPLKILLKSLFINKNYSTKLKDFLEKKHKRTVILTSSGSSAIYIALKQIEKISGKGEVITSNYSCKSIPRTIIKAGFTPIFVDVNKRLSFNKKDLLKAIKENKDAKAIISWHPEGFVFDEEITKISKQFKIPLIEDCASSFALINREDVGNLGDYSIFSFRTGKLIHGGGGALISNLDIKDKLESKNILLVFFVIFDLILRQMYNLEKPKAIFDHFFDILGNKKISEKEAFLAYYQIQNLDNIRNRRKINFEFILKGANLDNYLDLNRKNISPCPTSLILLINKRKEFISFMKKNKIKVTKDHSHVNSEVFNGKEYGKINSKEISEKICHIPVHEHLSKKDLNNIVGAIKKWNSLKI
jgi:dTDP-4-amino-4,6-dideoxygalactose transaminase